MTRQLNFRLMKKVSLRLHCRRKLEPADSCFSNPWVAVMLVMRNIVSFVAVFGLLWILMVKAHPAWLYIFQLNYKIRDWNKNSEASHVVLSIPVTRPIAEMDLWKVGGSHGAQYISWMGQDTSPRRFDTFLTWVRRWDKVYFQLVDNQAFQAKAKHLTVLDEYEQMFNILSWIIYTF